MPGICCVMTYLINWLWFIFVQIPISVTHIEAHRRSASSSSSSSPTLNAENPSNLSSTYSKPIVTSPLQLTLTQVNGRSIVSNNYPDVFNRHAYRWPFIASTTTAKPILLARKPDSQWQTGTNNVDVGLSSTAADVTSTQQAIVDHRAHAHHHTGLGWAYTFSTYTREEKKTVISKKKTIVGPHANISVAHSLVIEQNFVVVRKQCLHFVEVSGD